MSLWNHLYRQTEARVGHVADLREETARDSEEAREERRALQTRVQRLELIVEGLVRVLAIKGVATTDELALAIEQADLADGVEDGRIGPDRTAQAAPCGHCGQPLNPKRRRCIYCDTPYAAEATRRPVPPPRQTICGQCEQQVLARTTFLTEHGTRCRDCYYGGAPAGSLSLAPGQGGELSHPEA